MVTAFSVICVLILILILIGAAWYYIKAFGGIFLGNGCSGCGLGIVLFLAAVAAVIYALME